MSSLILRPPPFFVLQFVFSIIHGSGRHSALPRPCTILNANRRTKNGEPKNKKQGRPGNKATLCLWTERQPYTNWKLVKLSFLKNTYRYQAVHSNAFPYFTDLSVSSSLWCLYSTRAWQHKSTQCKPPTCITPWCNTLVLAEKRLDKIVSSSNSIIAEGVGFSVSGSHVHVVVAK